MLVPLIDPPFFKFHTWQPRHRVESSNKICVLCCVFAPQVISCVGAPESATLDPSAPRRIDGDGSVALVEAAAAAGNTMAAAEARVLSLHMC